ARARTCISRSAGAARQSTLPVSFPACSGPGGRLHKSAGTTPCAPHRGKSMINRVTIVGRLTRDPEVHATTTGGKLANLRIVTDEFRRDADGNRQEDVQYHSVVAFGRLGEVCADYLRKGRLVYIEGKLR